MPEVCKFYRVFDSSSEEKIVDLAQNDLVGVTHNVHNGHYVTEITETQRRVIGYKYIRGREPELIFEEPEGERNSPPKTVYMPGHVYPATKAVLLSPEDFAWVVEALDLGVQRLSPVTQDRFAEFSNKYAYAIEQTKRF